jgi:hypothetical protein
MGARVARAAIRRLILRARLENFLRQNSFEI